MVFVVKGGVRCAPRNCLKNISKEERYGDVLLVGKRVGMRRIPPVSGVAKEDAVSMFGGYGVFIIF